ncbi:MAG: TonB-dependent receptor [Acidobacteriaceae bacterium]|nr:TonB-dependent receptor [Acidobacteriaceae bacterium]
MDYANGVTKIPNKRRAFVLICLLMNQFCWFASVAVQTGLAADANSELHGTVFTLGADGKQFVVPGANVTLTGQVFSKQTITDEQGTYRFTNVPPGTYQIEAKAPGLTGSSAVTVVSGRTVESAVWLKVETIKESVTVNGGDTPAIQKEPSDQTVIARPTVLLAPNKYERFDSLLPLIPGVVRGPDGLINMKGARSSQGGSLLNSANVTDPVTGNTAMNLPIDVVESVKVIANPYDPEYGRLAGAVSSVSTVTSNFNAFHFSIQNMLPRPRKRNGDFIGIEAATPRLTLTGPLVKDKVAFTSSFEYRFLRTPVSSLPPLERDMKLEGINSYNQLDVNLTERQSLTASFALYPQKVNYLGLNTFTPQPSTPDFHQRGDMTSIQHRYTTGPDSLLLSQFTYKHYDADLTANSGTPYGLFVETTEGGFFNRQRRDTYRTEWQETYQFGRRHFFGTHNVKAGLDVAHSNYDGRIAFLPVSILGTTHSLLESMTFSAPARFDIRQNETSGFIADNWTPWSRITIDLGLRFDRDSITSAAHAAPRAGFALMLTKDAKTLLKGGAGIFYDRVPLNVASFPLLPDRTVTQLDPQGQTLNSVAYVNTIAGNLRNPRSIGWNVELDREVTSALALRAGFLQRNTSWDFALNPESELDHGILSLSNTGHSFYREFQVSGRYKIRQDVLNASYVRSKAYGDLNDFNQFFGNNPTAVINPNASARLPFDAPNRVLFWGQFHAPLKLTLMPVFDVHTGFPYSVIDQSRDFVGARDAVRLPRFNSLDLMVTRPITLPIPNKDIKARIGFSVYNILNHFNPRDVQNDIDSYRFGALFNGVGRTFRGKFVLEF